MKDIFIPIIATTISFIVFYIYDNNLPLWLSALSFSAFITFIVCFIRDILRLQNIKGKS